MHGSADKLTPPVGIRAVAVLHKNAEKVPQILGEHLGGRHRWAVGMEVDYHPLESGFVLLRLEQGKKKARALLDLSSPPEFKKAGMGYVELAEAPEELIETLDLNEMRIKPDAICEKMRVVLLKGGINGKVHYKGVGLVRLGAEGEA